MLHVCGKRDYHKHQSAHHHKEVDETPHGHEFEYKCHFRHSFTVRQRADHTGRESLYILTTHCIKEHKQSFRLISTEASQATALMHDLEIIRKMSFSKGNLRFFQLCLHVSH